MCSKAQKEMHTVRVFPVLCVKDLTCVLNRNLPASYLLVISELDELFNADLLYRQTLNSQLQKIF